MGKFKTASDEDSAAAGPRKFETCSECQKTYQFPGIRDHRTPGNRIVGRSINGGFLCCECYERGANYDYRDKALDDFRERHQGDMWGALLRASKGLETTQERRDLLAQLKRLMPAIGALPYNPKQREAP